MKTLRFPWTDRRDVSSVRRPRRVAAVFLTVTALSVGGLQLSPVGAASVDTRAESDGPTVSGLSVEHLVEPVGIGTDTPRFSWQATSSARGQTQKHYEIEVSPGTDGFDDTPVWDTGRVTSDEQLLVAYDGDQLASSEAYQWRVRIWDQDGRVSDWSEPATFATGLLKAADWQASWISPASDAAGGSYVRGEFSLPSTPRRAMLYVAGRGNYERGADGNGICCEQDFGLARGIYLPFVNGARIGDAEYESQPVDSRKRAYYRAYDVTSELSAGDNVIGLSIGEDSDLIAQLVVENADGSRQVIASGAGWKSVAGPTTRAARYNGETYDTRRERADWSSPGNAGAGWEPVRVPTGGRGTVDAAPNEPMRVVKTIDPVKVTEPTAGVYVLDFGQNISGRTRIKTTIGDGKTVTIKHGERLANGRVDNNLIMAQQTSKITGNGSSVNFAPSYTYAGFRWAEVTGLSQAPTAGTIVAEEIHNDVEVAGSFSAANDLLNRLHTADVQTQVNGMHGIPEDTPTREKRGWTADAHIAAEATMNNKDMAAFYTKWITDIRDATGSDGWVPDIVPTELGAGWTTRSDPAWASATALMPYYAWKQYGDRDIVEDHYESVAKWVDYVGTKTTDNLVTHPTGAWGNDWLSIETTDGKLFRTGYYYWGAKIMSEFAAELGRDADVARYDALAADIAKAINSAYFDGRSSYGSSQFANAFPLVLGIVPDGKDVAVAKNLAKNVVEKRKNHFTGGLPGIKYIPEALEKYGYNDVVLDVVTQTEYPSWGYMLENGPGTIWEDWHNGASSLNHPMFTSIDNWLYTAVAGIRQAEGSEGYRELLFEPRVTADLPSASGERATPYGTASIDWKQVGNSIDASIEVPFNSTATIVLPGARAAEVVESGRPVAEADGVTSVKQTPDGVQIKVGSGGYDFSSDNRLGLLVDARDNIAAAGAAIDELTLNESDRAALVAEVAAATTAVESAVQAHLSGDTDTRNKAIAALDAARQIAQRAAPLPAEANELRSAAAAAVDALSRYLSADLAVAVVATTPERIIEPGDTVPLTIRATSTGTGSITKLTETVQAPQGWTAKKTRAFTTPVAPGAEATAEYTIGTPEQIGERNGKVTVQVDFTVDGIDLTQLVTVDLQVESAVEVGDVSVDPVVVDAGGHAYVRADLGNRLGSATTNAKLAIKDLPQGWTAADTSAVTIAPSGRRVVNLRLDTTDAALSGVSTVEINDQNGEIISTVEVDLLVRGSDNCDIDETGAACLPASTVLLSSFEAGAEGWVAGENSSTVEAVTSFANGPGVASLGKRALEIQPAGSPAADAWRSAKVTLADPVTTGSAHSLLVDVNGYGGGGATHSARIVVTGADGAVAQTEQSVTPDSWNLVRVPLDSLSGQAVKGVEVSFRGSSSAGWPARFQIDGVRLDSAPLQGDNLARGRTVTASNPLGCCNWNEDRLTDGLRRSTDSSSGYSSATAHATPDNVEWVRIDLGEKKDVGRVLLFPRTARSGEAAELTGRNFPSSFQIQVSDNGTDWTSVGSFTGQQASNGTARTYITDEGAEGRYVRVYVTKLGLGAPDEQGEASGGHRLQMAEVEVYAPYETDAQIISQPSDVTTAAGSEARFTIGITGEPLPRVTWQRSTDGGAFEDLPNSVGTTLLLPAVAKTDDASIFRAVVDDGAGEPLISEPVTLSVDYSPLKISAQPKDVSLPMGATTARFTATVTGDGARRQWQRSRDGVAWRPVKGQTGETLELVLGDGVADGDRVRLVGWNALGEFVTSEAARLTVQSKPVISGLPERVSVLLGKDIELSATVAGSPEPSVQWLRRAAGVGQWTDITGETSSRLSLRPTMALNGGQIGLRATSPAGETLAVVAVTVIDPDAPKPAPQALTAPTVRGRAVVGSTLTASPGRWNIEGLRYGYQWLRDGAAIKGATRASYRLTPSDQAHRLRVRVTAAKVGHQSGTATSGTTARIASASSKIAIKPSRTSLKSRQRLKVGVTVTAPSLTPTGKVDFYYRGKKVRTLRLKNGKVSTTFRPSVKGRFSLKVVYRGAKGVKSSSSSVRIRVR
ncbi:family 78 glycoside hydrolase catalytic domain [Aeromicrobium sp. P5_D10]